MVGGDDSVSGGCLLALDLTLRKCEMLLVAVDQSGGVVVHRLSAAYLLPPSTEYCLIEQLHITKYKILGRLCQYYIACH